MHLTPLQGLSNIKFGMSHVEVIRLLGVPDNEEWLHDVESHPKHRCQLTYADCTLTVNPELGVFGIFVRAASGTLILWETEINDLSVQQFAALLASHGVSSVIAPLTAWGSTDVYSAEYGILAYFAGDRLSEIELQIPNTIDVSVSPEQRPRWNLLWFLQRK